MIESAKSGESSADRDSGRPQGRSADFPACARLPCRQWWGSIMAGSAVWLTLAAGAGFLIAYRTGATHWLLGGTLAIALAGCVSTLLVWAHWLRMYPETVESCTFVYSVHPEKEKLV